MRGLSLVAASGGPSSSRCAGLSLSRPLLLQSTGSRRAGSVIVAHGPSCSAACGIIPDQGSNPRPLHWQADSQPLRHQGSPQIYFLNPTLSYKIGIGLLVSKVFVFDYCNYETAHTLLNIIGFAQLYLDIIPDLTSTLKNLSVASHYLQDKTQAAYAAGNTSPFVSQLPPNFFQPFLLFSHMNTNYCLFSLQSTPCSYVVFLSLLFLMMNSYSCLKVPLNR